MTAGERMKEGSVGRPRGRRHVEARRRTRRLAPRVIGICLVMILAAVAFVILPSPALASNLAQASGLSAADNGTGPELIPGTYVTLECTHGTISLEGTQDLQSHFSHERPLRYCFVSVLPDRNGGFWVQLLWVGPNRRCLGGVRVMPQYDGYCLHSLPIWTDLFRLRHPRYDNSSASTDGDDNHHHVPEHHLLDSRFGGQSLPQQ